MRGSKPFRLRTRPTEKQVEQSILYFIRAIGGWATKVQSGTMPTPTGGLMKLADKGTPDILACIGGRFIAIEVKRDESSRRRWEKRSDSTSDFQHHQLELIRDAGGVTIVATSSEEVETDIRSLGLIKTP